MQRLKQTEDGDLQLPIFLVDGVASVQAAAYNLFSTQAQDEREGTSDGVTETIKGEWPFDRSHGMRWRGVVLRKYFSSEDTRALTADTLNQIPEVLTVSPSQVTLEFLFDPRQVNITVSDVRLTNGEMIPTLALSVAV